MNRKFISFKWAIPATLASFGLISAHGQTAFQPPEGGWDYLYQGDQAAYGPADAAFDVAESLDGTWSHQNGSDEWDGSGIGGDFGPGNSPGGAMIIEEGGINYLRIQDTGDPRDYGYSDPGSNRKVYLGHSLTSRGASDTIMDDGVTLYFRARIPTSGPIDPLHRDGQQANGVQPYPTDDGDGYVTSDGGKGNFVIKQGAGGAIAFSLTTAADTGGGDPNSNPTGFTGLSMNEFDGNVVSGNVNFGQGLGENVIELDPTEWHEFWIVITRDQANVGTHIASIYIDGDATPKVFKMTAGTGSDFGGSYIALGATATPQNAALDIDFFGYKLSAVTPASKSFKDPEGGWNYAYEGDQDAYGPADAAFDVAESLDGTWSHQNGSDEWDGSGLGGDFGAGNSPGGAMSIEEGSASYLRIQDTGDPRDYGYADPGSNRKVYLGHNIAADGATDTIMDDGVTLHFRARIPTSGPLDPLHRDGQQANGVQPYPSSGDGYVTSDGGKGNFVIKQGAGGAIAFSLTTASDTAGGDPNSNPTQFTGLTMNEFDGNVVSGNVNFGQGLGQNIIPLDPTEWHEFWITIARDEANVGTHIASIYIDGNTSPQVFKMTAGTGSDFGGSYIAIGSTATPQNSALDIDFYRIKFAAVAPEGASNVLPPDFGSLSPGIGQTNVDPTQGVRFVATSAGSIPRENIQVILNGRDLSSDLEITGNEQRWEVALTTLGFNRTYEGKLVITDSEGASIESVLQFDTFKSDLAVIEGEDYNFEGGGFLDNVVLGFNPGPDNYLDRLATPGIDANDLTDPGAGDKFYRIGDIVGTVLSGDVARPKFADFPDLDSSLTDVLAGEWVNYTRTFAQGEWSLIARVASGGDFQIDVGQMNSTATSANQSPTPIGSFSGGSTGGNARYRYFQLRDQDGKAVKFNAGGPTTFRLTTVSGNYRVNFLYIIPGADVPDEEVVLEASNVAISVSNGQITVSWDKPGKLQSALSVTGPWSDEASDANSWTGAASGSAKYFRVIAQ